MKRILRALTRRPQHRPVQPPKSAQPPLDPTRRLALLETAAESLSLDRSIERTDAAARFVIGSITVVGSVLLGLGALSADTVSTRPWTALPALTAAVLSGTLAAIALVGRYDEINVEDLDDIESGLATVLHARRRKVRIAGILLVIALGCAVAPPVIAILTSRTNEIRLSVSWSDDAVRVAGSVTRPSPEARVHLSVLGNNRLIAGGAYSAMANSRLAFELKGRARGHDDIVTVRAVVRQAGAIVDRETIHLSR
jgi:hypothetical protein